MRWAVVSTLLTVGCGIEGEQVTESAVELDESIAALSSPWVAAYGYNAGGWRVEKHPRTAADVNGDGRADIIGFADNGVYVSRSTGVSFEYPQRWAAEFGYYAGDWRVERHPRVMADATGDDLRDVIGFSNIGTHVAPSSGFSFWP